MTIQPRQCKDCKAEGITTIRPVKYRGPRCTTHHHEWKRRTRDLAHGRHIKNGFGLTSEQYWKLYAAQGGKCYGCRRATGKTKRLAVDHDHKCNAGHPPDQGCIRCVRALLCGPCNQTIGRLNIEALCHLIEVLTDPPAQKILL